MPWRETCPMEQREKFIRDWLDEEWSMTALCESYGISRKTGYKWLMRFRQRGAVGLVNRSRKSHAHPNATIAAIEKRVIQLRSQRPFWGPRKLKKRLESLEPATTWPASSTIGSIIKRHGLVSPRRTRWRTPAYEGPFVGGSMPNDLWAADFKGWFMTQDRTRIDPFTVSDCASRYLIRCQSVARTTGESVRGQLTVAFQEFGMPKALRTDNGVPFATVGLGGLSPLSIWLIKLGIIPERIRPAHPEENGAHERMHRTLKQQTAKPPKANPMEQQAAFDRFRAEYNEERPHEALGMKTPAEVYAPSLRLFPRRLPMVEYPEGAIERQVTTNGTIHFMAKRIYLSRALIDETIGLIQTAEGWDVWFGPLLLGRLDLKKEVLQRLPTKVLPMSSV